MKKESVVFQYALVAVLGFSGCDDDDPYDEGVKAGKEACECVKNNSVTTCEEKLNKNYSKYLNNNKFYDGANTNPCGLDITKIKK